jgi:hypothetical protein
MNKKKNLRFKIIIQHRPKYTSPKGIEGRLKHTFYQLRIVKIESNGSDEPPYVLSYEYNHSTGLFVEPSIENKNNPNIGSFYYTRFLDKRKLARLINKWNLSNVSIVATQLSSNGYIVAIVK